MKEICIVAAVKLPDGRIIRGHRHSDCYNNLRGRPDRDSIFKQESQIIEGFLTSHNRFVDRKEGRRLQDEAGIPSADPTGFRGSILFSEDLY